jgi:hypothetical protein
MQLEVLAGDAEFQEAELAQIKLAALTDADHRVDEADELLQRRGVDPEDAPLLQAGSPACGSTS